VQFLLKRPLSKRPKTKWNILLGHSTGQKMLFKMPQKRSFFGRKLWTTPSTIFKEIEKKNK